MNSEGLDQSAHCAVWSWHSLFAYHVSSDTAKKTTSTRFKSSLVTITGPLKSLFLGIHLFAYDFPALLSLIYRGVVPTSDEVAVFPLAFSSESAKEEQDASDSLKERINFAYWVILHVFLLSSADFFQNQLFRKKNSGIPSEYQFGSRSGQRFCPVWSGSKLFAKVISRRH